MKKINLTILTLLLVFGSFNLAMADLYTWTDNMSWDKGQYIGMWDSYEYTHDITDGEDGFSGYLMGGDDIIWDYSLTLYLSDDYDRRVRTEIAFIDQPGFIGDGFYNFNYENEDFGWSLAGLISLNLTGMLDVSVDSWFGDFILDQSILVAHGDNGTGSAPVPEPATLILFGSGLLGVVNFGRKKLRK